MQANEAVNRWREKHFSSLRGANDIVQRRLGTVYGRFDVGGLELGLDVAAMRALSMNIGRTANIHTLGLSSCRISGESAAALVEQLTSSQNTGIRTLELADNALGDQGVRALADKLLENSFLTKLDLSSNIFGDAGAKWLASVVEVSPKTQSCSILQELILYGNGICEEGAIALERAVQRNVSLIVLDVRNNPFVSDAALMRNLKCTRADVEIKKALQVRSFSVAVCYAHIAWMPLTTSGCVLQFCNSPIFNPPSPGKSTTTRPGRCRRLSTSTAAFSTAR